MSDLELLYANAKNAGLSRDRNYQSVEFVASKIAPGEQVLGLLKGMKENPNKFVVIVLSDRGVHFFEKSGVSASFEKFGSAHEFFPFSKITELTTHIKWPKGFHITFVRLSSVDTIFHLQEDAAAALVETARKILNDAESTSNHVLVNQESPLDALAKLKSLHEAGVISDEEYEEKRKLYLGKI